MTPLTIIKHFHVLKDTQPCLQPRTVGHVCGIDDNHGPFSGGDVAEGLSLEYVFVIETIF